MTRSNLAVALLGCCLCLEPAGAEGTAPVEVERLSLTDELAPLVRSLFAAIEALSDYRAPASLPPIFEIPQRDLEARVCDGPCSVTAAYLPREGIYLAANLDPAREEADRGALLHELVHYLQQGHPKFAQLHGCERERAKEQEAYAIENAYLAMIRSHARVTFYDGEFDCEAQLQPAERRP